MRQYKGVVCISTVQKRFKLHTINYENDQRNCTLLGECVRNNFQRFFQVFLMVVTSILALPQRIVTNPQTATIIQHENNNIGVGSYHFA